MEKLGLGQNELRKVNSNLTLISLYINKQWGDKTGRGFYKKEIKEKGKRVFYEIDLKTLKYKDTEKTKDESLLEIKKSEQLEVRIKKLINLKNKYGDFYRSTFYDTFRYFTRTYTFKTKERKQNFIFINSTKVFIN